MLRRHGVPNRAICQVVSVKVVTGRKVPSKHCIGSKKLFWVPKPILELKIAKILDIARKSMTTKEDITDGALGAAPDTLMNAIRHQGGFGKSNRCRYLPIGQSTTWIRRYRAGIRLEILQNYEISFNLTCFSILNLCVALPDYNQALRLILLIFS